MSREIHDDVAFTPEGLCLGVVDAKIWARSPDGFGDSKKRQHDPLETKETFRWREGYRLACAVAREIPGTQIVSVADREGDIYELFVEAQNQGTAAADFVIRAGKDRSLPDRDPDAGDACYEKLKAALDAAPPLGLFLLLLAKLGGHNGRRKDGPPGPQALWTGIRRMTDFASAGRAFGPKEHQTTSINETCDTCV